MEQALERNGHFPAPYIDAVDAQALEKGINIAPSQARFSTGYGDLVRIPTVLVETHSLKPYRQRVLGTYVLLEAALRSLAEHGAELEAAAAADERLRPRQVVLGWTPRPTPVGRQRLIPISNETYRSPASGREEVRWTGRRLAAIEVPVFGADPAAMAEAPRAYWVPATKPEVIERLALHGIAMERLSEPRKVTVELTRFAAAAPAARVNEGRVPITAQGFARERRAELYPAGSVRVPVDQPLGELAMILLEPEGDDSFFAWGFFPELLQRTEYIEGYAIAPLAERMLAEDPRLRAEFEAKLKSEPAFAADGDARLSWFYARTPYWDERHMLYPVGRELP